MGKPSDNLPIPSPNAGPTTPLTEPSSAINLHTSPTPTNFPPPSQRYFDEDPTVLDSDELPPLYDEIDHHGVRDEVVDPLAPAGIRGHGLNIQPFYHDSQNDTAYYLDGNLENDAKFLHSTLETLAKMPPRPFAHVKGTHSETRRHSDGHHKDERTETVTIVDFDIEIELTHLLYTDIRNPENGAWRQLCSVGNFEKVRRGTIFPTRAPGFGGSGAAENGTPSVEEWCHRFCASSSGLKNMSFGRRVMGYDWELLRRRLEGLVRATNYRGNLDISFPVRNASVEIYNDCHTNQWRLTRWIKVLCALTLLFIFTWPWLFFRTKRWETVYVEWHMSRDEDDGTGCITKRYAAMSEEEWYTMWAKAIQKAVLERRQGQLDQGDIERAGRPEERAEGFAGLVQSGVEAMGFVNRSFGWGGNSDGGFRTGRHDHRHGHGRRDRGFNLNIGGR